MPPMPMPGAGGPPGGGGPGMPSPMMPKNPAGGPSGPGSSPAMSPGAGKGNQEAARAQIKAILTGLHAIQQAFDVYSDEYKAIAEMLRSGTSTFGKQSKEDLVPAAIQNMVQANQQGKPFQGAQPAGMQPPKPPGGGMPGMPPSPIPGG